MRRLGQLWVLALVLTPALASAGPHPRVLVLYNPADPEALQTARHYQTARALEDGQLCPTDALDPAVATVDVDTFDTAIRRPMEACRDARPNPDAVDTLVLVKGLPRLVSLGPGGFVTSLSGALEVGRATDGNGDEVATLPQAESTTAGVFRPSLANPAFVGEANADASDFTLTNPADRWYRATSHLTRTGEWPEGPNRWNVGSAGGVDYLGELYLVARLDGFTHADVRTLIDRTLLAETNGVAGETLCMAAADGARGARDPECALLAERLGGLGAEATWLETHDPSLSGHTLAALLTGTVDLKDVSARNTFVPGSFVSNLTSFGAVPENFDCDAGTCPASERQTSVARFVAAGATAVHGTAAEPLNTSFPSAGAVLLYRAGYPLGEAVLMARRFLRWQDVLLGDPLARPYLPAPEPPTLESAFGLSCEAKDPQAPKNGDTLCTTVTTEASALAPTGWPLGSIQPRTGRADETCFTLALEPCAESDPPAPAGCGCGVFRESGAVSAILWLLLLGVMTRRGTFSSVKG